MLVCVYLFLELISYQEECLAVVDVVNEIALLSTLTSHSALLKLIYGL